MIRRTTSRALRTRIATRTAFTYDAYGRVTETNFLSSNSETYESVDVRCWPIEKFHLGALGFKHCFVTVVDKDSKCHDITGGPDENNLLHEWDIPAQLYPTAATYNHSAVPC